ncbi:MAG: hypothetical protein ABI672_13350 [Vicinamibacteria bacterium]
MRVHPSQANFLLLELPVEASEVVSRLIERCEILIKDVNPNGGFVGAKGFQTLLPEGSPR